MVDTRPSARRRTVARRRSSRTPLSLLLLALLAGLLAAAPARAGALVDCAWSSGFAGAGPDSTVKAQVVYDDGGGPALYAGGEFLTAGGVVANGVARWDGDGWTELRGPSGVGVRFGEVRALAVYDDGGGPALFVAGTFTRAGNVTAGRIAKWDGHTWSALTGPSGQGVDPLGGARVSALAVYDDGGGPKLYVGGLFGMAGGVPATNLAAWDGQVWSAVSTGAAIGYEVDALAVYDDGGGPALFVGGYFQLPGGVTVNNIARWNGSAWSALSGPAGTGVGGLVYALAVYDDGGGPALFATGSFATAGGVTVNNVARWRGGAWAPLSGPAGTGTGDFYGLSLAVHDDGGGAGLYLGGYFTTAGGVTVDHVARWRGGAWAALTGPAGSGTSSAVYALANFDDGGGADLYVGGSFLLAGGRQLAGLARWDGVLWTALVEADAHGMSGTVGALAVYDDGGGPDLYAGGRFDLAGGVEVNRIARWDGSSWSTLTGPAGEGVAGGPSPVVAELAVYDDGGGPALYAGGSFVTAGGVTVNGIAKWDGSGWSALSGPAGTGVGGGGGVSALAVYDDGGGPALYAGGSFVTAGGVTVDGVAKWDGTAWSALVGPSGFGASGPVGSFAVYDDGSGPALYVGGDFVSAGGVMVNHVARWDGLAWTGLTGPSGTGTDYSVYALHAYYGGGESNLYAGGSFLHAGGVPASYVAKWDGQAWSAVPGLMGTPLTFDVEDDGAGPTLVVGGFVDMMAGGMEAHGVARWDGTEWLVFSGPAGSGVNGYLALILALAVYDGGDGDALYAGGLLLGAGGVPARNIARWACVPPVFADGFESGDLSAWSGVVP